MLSSQSLRILRRKDTPRERTFGTHGRCLKSKDCPKSPRRKSSSRPITPQVHHFCRRWHDFHGVEPHLQQANTNTAISETGPTFQRYKRHTIHTRTHCVCVCVCFFFSSLSRVRSPLSSEVVLCTEFNKRWPVSKCARGESRKFRRGARGEAGGGVAECARRSDLLHRTKRTGDDAIHIVRWGLLSGRIAASDFLKRSYLFTRSF